MRYVQEVNRALPQVTVLGVPSSAGAHHAGQDLAPAALRSHGFVDRLVAAGVDVRDLGDLAGEIFAVDHAHPAQRNLAAVVRVAHTVADRVEHARRTGAIVIVLGGDCTITLGVLAGIQRIDSTAGLLYFDGDADLNAPVQTRSGILDATGIAHVLGIADTELGHLDGKSPMLEDDHLVMLGYDETDPDSFNAKVFEQRPSLRRFADHVLRADPTGTAHQALNALSAAAGSIVVHFDVDAVNSGDLPLANFPHYGTGVDLTVAARVLSILCSAPNLAAIVLTEVNPTHDPGGTHLDRYVDAVTGAISTGLTTHRLTPHPDSR